MVNRLTELKNEKTLFRNRSKPTDFHTTASRNLPISEISKNITLCEEDALLIVQMIDRKLKTVTDAVLATFVSARL